MGSLYSYSNDSIQQAFLPNRGMRFQGAGDAKLHNFLQGGPTTALGSQRNANTSLLGTTANTSISGGTANGTISGGALRPGAIDQTQFKAMLNAAQAGVPGAAGGASMLPGAPSSGLLPLAPNAALAAQGLQPAHTNSFSELSANAATGAAGGAQTLTAAQFAALTGGVNLPAGAMPTGAMPNMPMQGMAPLPPGARISNDDGTAATAIPTAQSIPVSQTVPVTQPVSATRAASDPNTLTMSDAAIPADGPNPATDPNALTMSDASIPADGTGQVANAVATASGSGTGTGDDTPIGSVDKNGVLVLNQIPDKDTRREYEAKGIKWRIVDNPESNKLFFGPDGKFSWDDVVDLINPLQHIPLVNIAYRHFTGDEINGSAELLGAIPFGPASVLAAIADLAVKSTTGKDIGENVIAMITGDHDSSSETLAQTKTDTTTDQTNGGNATVAAIDVYNTREHNNGHG